MFTGAFQDQCTQTMIKNISNDFELGVPRRFHFLQFTEEIISETPVRESYL